MVKLYNYTGIYISLYMISKIIQEKAQQDAAEAAARPHVPPGAAPREGWQFPNQRNVRRNGMRKKAADTARRARWADAEEGELSSDGQSVVGD